MNEFRALVTVRRPAKFLCDQFSKFKCSYLFSVKALTVTKTCEKNGEKNLDPHSSKKITTDGQNER